MSEVYLIKKETLTAIAKGMVNLAPDYFNEDSIITPEDIAGRMSEVKEQGYDEGYDDGWVATGIDDIYIPLVIQAQNHPVDASDYSAEDVMFQRDLFEGVSVGTTTYNWLDGDMEYEVVSSSADFSMTVINNTDRYVCVYVYIECEYEHQSDLVTDDFFKKLMIAPNGDASFDVAASLPGMDYEWNYNIEGLRFI